MRDGVKSRSGNGKETRKKKEKNGRKRKEHHQVKGMGKRGKGRSIKVTEERMWEAKKETCVLFKSVSREEFY